MIQEMIIVITMIIMKIFFFLSFRRLLSGKTTKKLSFADEYEFCFIHIAFDKYELLMKHKIFIRNIFCICIITIYSNDSGLEYVDAKKII